MFTKFKNFFHSCLCENTHVGYTIQWFHQSTLEYQLFFTRYLHSINIVYYNILKTKEDGMEQQW